MENLKKILNADELHHLEEFEIEEIEYLKNNIEEQAEEGEVCSMCKQIAKKLNLEVVK